MNILVDVGAVIAVVEIIKKVVKAAVGYDIEGEFTILLAAVIGAVLAVAQGGDPVTGLFQGGAAVAAVTVAGKVNGK